MRNKFFLKAAGLLLFLLFQLSSFAQIRPGYENGIIELNNRQTVVGYIKKLDFPDMLSRISFKQSLEDENPTSYDTSQLRRYWIGSKETYELLRFSVNNAAGPVARFAKMIVRGDASLFKTLYQGEVIYLVRKDNRLAVLQSDKPAGSKSKTPTVAAGSAAQLKQVLGQPVTANENSSLAFSEKNFIDLVSAYNRSAASPNDLMLAKEEPISFLLATVGGGLQQNDGKEFFLHSAYRVYFPELSRDASLNVGFNFYASKYTETIKINFYDYDFNYTSLLFAVPVEVQYNLLSKAVRPFVSAGFTVAYNSVKDQYGNAENRMLKNNFGLRPVYSGGVEADFGKNFLAKACYRREIYSHLVLVGVGYRFSK